MAYAGGAAVAAMAQAVQASGAILTVDPENFSKIAAKSGKPLVVISKGGMFKSKYQYLTTYKGLVFFTKSEKELILPIDTEIINVKKIWVPGQY